MEDFFRTLHELHESGLKLKGKYKYVECAYGLIAYPKESIDHAIKEFILKYKIKPSCICMSGKTYDHVSWLYSSSDDKSLSRRYLDYEIIIDDDTPYGFIDIGIRIGGGV